MDFSNNFTYPVTLSVYNSGIKSKFSLEGYNEDTTIKVRIEGGSRYVRDDKGQLYESKRWYMTTTPLQPGDKIDGYYIVTVKEYYDMDGVTFLYNEGYV